MEEDDEFGDLYSDVLQPFSQSSSFPSQPIQLSSAPLSFPRSVDLNLRIAPDDEENGVSCSSPGISLRPSTDQPLVLHRESDGGFSMEKMDEQGVEKIENLSCGNPKLGNICNFRGAGSDVMLEKLDNDVNLMDDDVKFDIEDAELDPIIPGLSGGGGGVSVQNSVKNVHDNDENVRGDGFEGDDWDSDSEDDLQIVLNDGSMALERTVDDDDGNGELVIVAGGEVNQAMEEQEWGEDADQAADGERKDAAEVPKRNGGMALPPKVGYGNNGYHPFHSQFKYIRPGAPIPGSATSAPGSAPSHIRPLGSMGHMAGRGRGDWRPVGIKSAPHMQKGFGSAWGADHGVGGGMEFTLPSHKTIFEVDINGFEEKPWKYPGVDTSDFFNFGFDEESWKDYCRQLEQLRLESTMQSKIRVYESGRMEPEYDPDLPPELAAAIGIHDVQAESASIGKSDTGNLVKGSIRGRPPLPTGRAIQVEGGGCDRLPSIDTRPPRARDSDAIIEIVCDDSVNDDFTGNDILDQTQNDATRKDLRRGYPAEENIASGEMEFFNGIKQTDSSRKKEQTGTRESFMNTVDDNMHEGDGVLPLRPKTLASSQERSPVISYEERGIQGRERERSPVMDPGRNTEENQKEDSVESMDVKQSPLSSYPVTAGVDKESSVGHADAVNVLRDGISRMENKEMSSDAVKYIYPDGELLRFRQSSRAEPPMVQEQDENEDSKAERSSESSKAGSGSCKDNEKWLNGFEEEVTEVGRMGTTKKYPGDSEQTLQRKRHEVERNCSVVRGRDGSNSDWGHSLVNHSFDRRNERGNPDAAYQRRDNERRIRTEDKRKRGIGEELGFRHRAKVQKSERSDKDEHLSRKHLDNGSYRIPYDKDLTSGHREIDGILNSRYEIVDDYHRKRRKHEEYSRDQAVKEEIVHGHRGSISRRRREREDIVEQRKRDEQKKVRDITDVHNLGRNKDESWLQREREEWHRQKHSHEENLLKRGKEGRDTLRVGREDKVHGSEKHFQYKNTVRPHEEFKRRGRIEDESLQHQRGREYVYARGKKFINEERGPRQERPFSCNDAGVNSFDNPRVHEKKHKESTTNRESGSGVHNTLKRTQDEVGHNNEMGMKNRSVSGNGEIRISAQHHTLKEHTEGASSDDEQQNSRKGRSKLERWENHQERDFTINSKKPSSFNLKEIDMNNNVEYQESSNPPDESAKTVQGDDNQHVLSVEKAVGDREIKDADMKPAGERHLDTVEKLKKRSERFKQPTRSEKEVLVIKKIDNEALPSTKSEIPEESEIKQERPARKRRWISN